MSVKAIQERAKRLQKRLEQLSDLVVQLDFLITKIKHPEDMFGYRIVSTEILTECLSALQEKLANFDTSESGADLDFRARNGEFN